MGCHLARPPTQSQENFAPMNNSRAFLHITYKLYGHLDKLSGTKKSNCINCYLSLMKHAWKKE